jgi:hypothetical protein
MASTHEHLIPPILSSDNSSEFPSVSDHPCLKELSDAKFAKLKEDGTILEPLPCAVTFSPACFFSSTFAIDLRRINFIVRAKHTIYNMDRQACTSGPAEDGPLQKTSPEL